MQSIVALLALATMATATIDPQKATAVEAAKDLQDCAFSCWNDATKKTNCDSMDFNCICKAGKNTSNNVQGYAGPCVYKACGEALTFTLALGDFCFVIERPNASKADVDAAKKIIEDKLNKKGGSSSSPKPTTASPSAPSSSQDTNKDNNTDKKGAAGSVGVNFALMGIASLFALTM